MRSNNSQTKNTNEKTNAIKQKNTAKEREPKEIERDREREE